MLNIYKHKKKPFLKQILFIGLIAFGLNGCSLNLPKKHKPSAIQLIQEINLQTLKKNAQYALNNKKATQAIEFLESIRTIYPYTDEAEWAIINLVQIYHQQNKNIELIMAANQFLLQNPSHPQKQKIAFYYAQAYFNKMGKKSRDQASIIEAVEVLEWFLEEFEHHDCIYCPQIKKKLAIANGRLVFRELEIGNFYEKKRNFIAALKRYLHANEISSNNIYTSEILYRIYYCYTNIGLYKDAEIYYQKLHNEHQQSSWFKLAHNLQSQIHNK